MSLPAARNGIRDGLLILWPILLVFDTGGQLALKLGSSALIGKAFGPAWFGAILSSPFVWAAIGCYLCAFATWMLILHRSDLSFAFPITALVYITVLLASWLLLGEAVNAWRWLGVALIVAGVWLGGQEEAELAAEDRS